MFLAAKTHFFLVVQLFRASRDAHRRHCAGDNALVAIRVRTMHVALKLLCPDVVVPGRRVIVDVVLHVEFKVW